MTAYTPIYNLPYVEPSDLVATYPTVSEELAENVETAIAASGGMAYIGTYTASAATSIIANNVFTADYSVYQMYAVLTTTNNDHQVSLRLRASGTDATSSAYRFQQIYGQNSVSGAYVNTTAFATGSVDNDDANALMITLINPQLASPTGFFQHQYIGYSTGQGIHFAGIHNLSTAYDGFNLYSASAFTASVYLYGLKNS